MYKAIRPELGALEILVTNLIYPYSRSPWKEPFSLLRRKAMPHNRKQNEATSLAQAYVSSPSSKRCYRKVLLAPDALMGIISPRKHFRLTTERDIVKLVANFCQSLQEQLTARGSIDGRGVP